MIRNTSILSIILHPYVISVLSFIAIMYLFILYAVFPQKPEENIGTCLYLLWLTILSFLIYWCFIQTMMTDPGRVPQCWGFFMDDPEHKKRRYCLKCHIFKPERCHHCSACNRCVLNMDHHCPWINNCVGFYNRKYFLLLIFYVNVDLFFILILMYSKLFIVLSQKNIFDQIRFQEICMLVPTILLTPLFFVILNFMKFHINLVQENMTTIENLEKQKQLAMNEIVPSSKYNNGFQDNWEQIFGRNKFLWLFPMTGESGKPIGDGVLWDQKTNFNLETSPLNQDQDDDGTQNTKQKQSQLNTINKNNYYDPLSNRTSQQHNTLQNGTPTNDDKMKFNFTPDTTQQFQRTQQQQNIQEQFKSSFQQSGRQNQMQGTMQSQSNFKQNGIQTRQSIDNQNLQYNPNNFNTTNQSIQGINQQQQQYNQSSYIKQHPYSNPIQAIQSPVNTNSSQQFVRVPNNGNNIQLQQQQQFQMYNAPKQGLGQTSPQF